MTMYQSYRLLAIKICRVAARLQYDENIVDALTLAMEMWFKALESQKKGV